MLAVKSGPNSKPRLPRKALSSFFGECLGAVEHHVLKEVGNAALLGSFIDRAGLDNQAKLYLGLGTFIFKNEVLEAVV